MFVSSAFLLVQFSPDVSSMLTWLQKLFWCQKQIDINCFSKKILSKNVLTLKNLLISKQQFRRKILNTLTSKIRFLTTIFFFTSKLFDVKLFLTSKLFWRQKFFDVKSFWRQNLLTSKLFYVKNFWRQKCLTSTIFDVKIFWRQTFLIRRKWT